MPKFGRAARCGGLLALAMISLSACSIEKMSRDLSADLISQSPEAAPYWKSGDYARYQTPLVNIPSGLTCLQQTGVFTPTSFGFDPTLGPEADAFCIYQKFFGARLTLRATKLAPGMKALDLEGAISRAEVTEPFERSDVEDTSPEVLAGVRRLPEKPRAAKLVVKRDGADDRYWLIIWGRAGDWSVEAIASYPADTFSSRPTYPADLEQAIWLNYLVASLEVASLQGLVPRAQPHPASQP